MNRVWQRQYCESVYTYLLAKETAESRKECIAKSSYSQDKISFNDGLELSNLGASISFKLIVLGMINFLLLVSKPDAAENATIRIC